MTATLAEPARGELKPTRSYRRRSWQWLPAGSGTPNNGILEIRLLTGSRVPTSELFTYAVQIVWEQCDADAGVWVFLLENLEEPNLDGPFQCVVGGVVESCGCEAAKYRLGCKHRDACAALVKEVV